jgi:hypothetical protein
MSAKEQVIEILNQLPNESSIQQISEKVALVAAVQEAREAVQRGDVYSPSDVRAMIPEWISKSS